VSLRLTPRGRLVQRLVLAFLGVSFGVVVSAVNHGFGPASEYVSKMIGNGLIWLAAGLGACLLGHGWKQSWVSGVVFFWPAIVGYYFADTVAGVYTSAPSTDPTALAQLDMLAVVSDTVGYVLVAAAASAVLALVVLASRRRGIVGLLGAVAVPGYITYAALTLHHGLKELPPRFYDPLETAITWNLGLAALTVTAVVAAVRLRRMLGARPGAGIARDIDEEVHGDPRQLWTSGTSG